MARSTAKSNKSAPAKSTRSTQAKSKTASQASTNALRPSGFETLQALHVALSHFDHAASRELSLNRSDAACLRLLSAGGRRASEIGQALGLTSGSVTALVDRLEAAKLVKRSVSETDRRAIQVVLTAPTARRLAKAYEPLEAALEAALGVKKKAALESLLAVARTFSV